MIVHSRAGKVLRWLRDGEEIALFLGGESPVSGIRLDMDSGVREANAPGESLAREVTLVQRGEWKSKFLGTN